MIFFEGNFESEVIVFLSRTWRLRRAIRIEMFGDEIERLAFIDPLRGTTLLKKLKKSLFILLLITL